MVIAACLGLALLSAADSPPKYAPLVADAHTFGRNIQRTMRALAESTPGKRNTVKILFYGQSITEQKWAGAVLADLRARFPHADIAAENRALAGFSSQLLVKTAESDLYPFYPDLLIFHVYGAHNSYEDIIRRVRERTTAEVLMQTDHVTKKQDFAEETDPAKLPPRGEHWDAFMNHNWLPSVAKKYGAELCDQRALWKQYLRENKLEPKALLSDNVHLNAHGEYLMAECVKSYLRRDAALESADDERVKTYVVGEDCKLDGGALALDFIGNRVDLVFKSGAEPRARVEPRLDGARPTALPGVVAFTRAVAVPGGKWPVVAGFVPTASTVPEDWTMRVTRDAANPKRSTFVLSGSVTGPDGEGASDAPFASKSGRVRIDPEHWSAEYAFMLAGVKPEPAEFVVRWKSVALAADEFAVPAARGAGLESAVTVAQGFANGPHRLTVAAGAESVAAVRVYRPLPAK